jgi:hypothetical protein
MGIMSTDAARWNESSRILQSFVVIVFLSSVQLLLCSRPVKLQNLRKSIHYFFSKLTLIVISVPLFWNCLASRSCLVYKSYCFIHYLLLKWKFICAKRTSAADVRMDIDVFGTKTDLFESCKIVAVPFIKTLIVFSMIEHKCFSRRVIVVFIVII